MKLSVIVRMSRASNLPTVWTNVMAGVALAGGSWDNPSIPVVLISLSLFYTAGMFLNDAFDRDFDARMRPDRPIPAGEISATQVFGMGFGLLVVGLAMLLGVALTAGGAGWGGVYAGILLGAAIVLYDAHHKNNALSPLIMGACRMLVYVIAAFAVVANPGNQVYIGAAVLLCYLIGLTYAAKKEHLNQLGHVWPLGLLAIPVVYGMLLVPEQPLVILPLALLSVWTLFAVRRLFRRASGDVPGAVAALLAGISLLDAVILAGHGHAMPMALALAAFLLTLQLQRRIDAT
jgi:hypothetical protein